MIEQLNATMLTDFYEITMANGYFESGMADSTAYFDMLACAFSSSAVPTASTSARMAEAALYIEKL